MIGSWESSGVVTIHPLRKWYHTWLCHADWWTPSDALVDVYLWRRASLLCREYSSLIKLVTWSQGEEVFFSGNTCLAKGWIYCLAVYLWRRASLLCREYSSLIKLVTWSQEEVFFSGNTCLAKGWIYCLAAQNEGCQKDQVFFVMATHLDLCVPLIP